MSYDYRKLRGRITEKFGNQYTFAEKMEWSERTCSLKISGKIYWKQDEISRACELLDIKGSEIQQYFFTLDVQLN